jgi:hypothetical protein
MRGTEINHVPPGPGAPQARPLRTTSIVIYATLALLLLTIPQSLVNWVKGFEPNRVQAAALSAAEVVADASHRLGLDRPFAWGRERFLAVTGKRDD